MDIKAVTTPQFDLLVNAKEAIVIRDALGKYMADPATSDKAHKWGDPMYAALTQQGLGDLA